MKTRVEAYLGKPCRYGHGRRRYRSDRMCVVCKAEINRERYAKLTRAQRERRTGHAISASTIACRAPIRAVMPWRKGNEHIAGKFVRAGMTATVTLLAAVALSASARRRAAG